MDNTTAVLLDEQSSSEDDILLSFFRECLEYKTFELRRAEAEAIHATFKADLARLQQRWHVLGCSVCKAAGRSMDTQPIGLKRPA